jgi:hypothetical protein
MGNELAEQVDFKDVETRKLQSDIKALINDCNKYKMNLATDGVVITDAIKCVQGNLDRLSGQEKASALDNNGSLHTRYQVQKRNPLDLRKEIQITS